MSRKVDSGERAEISTGTGNGTNGHAKQLYDPSQFIVPGRDHQGGSVRVWCRLMPSVDHEIGAIVQTGKWPFRTKGDFMRWCVWEGIKKLERMEPVSNSMIVTAETIMESCRAATKWLAFKTSVDSTEETVNALVHAGNESEALKLLSGLRASVLRLEEASWRDQWMREFDHRFGPLWEKHKKNAVNLT